jgi:hypothetical protein
MPSKLSSSPSAITVKLSSSAMPRQWAFGIRIIRSVRRSASVCPRRRAASAPSKAREDNWCCTDWIHSASFPAWRTRAASAAALKSEALMSAGDKVGAPSLMLIRRRHTARRITAATATNSSGASVELSRTSQSSLANSGQMPSSIGANQTNTAHLRPLPLAIEVASSRVMAAPVSTAGMPVAWAIAAGSRIRYKPWTPQTPASARLKPGRICDSGRHTDTQTIALSMPSRVNT